MAGRDEHGAGDRHAVERLTLRHPTGETSIFAGRGALAVAAADLAAWVEGRTVFVVSSSAVLELHGGALDPISTAARRWQVLEVEDGEAAKRIHTAERLWERMLEAGGKRDSRLVAFGGGSVGDLGGFVAGCFLRGIEFAQLPTTLLAQVDAALGGKTAVDLNGGKNSVGLFHHPRIVVAEASFLRTLPAGEVRSGLMEVVKMAMLLDGRLLRTVEDGVEDLMAGDPVALGPVVAAAARAKIGVVERDPTERGERRLLNFGHTLGHSLETALGYATLRHGDAVGYGMLFALRLAASRGLPEADARRLRELIRRLDPPPLPEVSSEQLVRLMARDKKASERGLAWVLPAAIGRGTIWEKIPSREVEVELESFLADPWGS